MKLRARLQRLERRTPPELPPNEPPGPEEEQIRAYFRGEGPRPPLPPDFNPSNPDSFLRIECCLLQRARGALKRGEYCRL